MHELQQKFVALPAAMTTLENVSGTAVVPAALETFADSEFISELVRLINEERAKAGVKPLVLDEKLTEIAGLKAKEMYDLSYFSHVSPNYGNPRQFAQRCGYANYSGVGENIYRAFNAKPCDIIAWWMQSPSHRKNLLNPMYTKAGFGGYGNLFYALELARN